MAPWEGCLSNQQCCIPWVGPWNWRCPTPIPSCGGHRVFGMRNDFRSFLEILSSYYIRKKSMSEQTSQSQPFWERRILQFLFLSLFSFIIFSMVGGAIVYSSLLLGHALAHEHTYCIDSHIGEDIWESILSAGIASKSSAFLIIGPATG